MYQKKENNERTNTEEIVGNDGNPRNKLTHSACSVCSCSCICSCSLSCTGGLNEQALQNVNILGGLDTVQQQVMDATVKRIRGESDGRL